MKGRVSISFAGQTLQTRRYTCEIDRERIKAGWKKTYGKGYEKAEIEDMPDIAPGDRPGFKQWDEKLTRRFFKGTGRKQPPIIPY